MSNWNIINLNIYIYILIKGYVLLLILGDCCWNNLLINNIHHSLNMYTWKVSLRNKTTCALKLGEKYHLHLLGYEIIFSISIYVITWSINNVSGFIIRFLCNHKGNIYFKKITSSQKKTASTIVYKYLYKLFQVASYDLYKMLSFVVNLSFRCTHLFHPRPEVLLG